MIDKETLLMKLAEDRTGYRSKRMIRVILEPLVKEKMPEEYKAFPTKGAALSDFRKWVEKHHHGSHPHLKLLLSIYNAGGTGSFLTELWDTVKDHPRLEAILNSVPKPGPYIPKEPVKVGDRVIMTKDVTTRPTRGTIRKILYRGQLATITAVDGSYIYVNGKETNHFRRLGKNEGVPTPRSLHFSDSFFKFLEKIQKTSRVARMVIAAKTLENEGLKNLAYRILNGEEATYITYRKDGTISYLPKGKEHVVNPDRTWNQKNRVNAKPAKVMAKIFSPSVMKILKQADFEIFNNAYKGEYSLDDYEFLIRPNTEIADVYQTRTVSGEASLNASCMRDKDQGFFSIYENCPNVRIIQLIHKPTGLMAGRALLWDVKEALIHPARTKTTPIIFMDRVYVAVDHLYEAFINYARENGFYHKKHYRTFDNKVELINLNEPDAEGGNEVAVKMKIFTKTEFGRYPYIDTFTWGSDEKGFICNYDHDEVEFECASQDGTRYDRRVKTYKGDRASRDECVEISIGDHAGEYALRGDVLETYDGGYALRHECRRVTLGGNRRIVHIDNIVEI